MEYLYNDFELEKFRKIPGNKILTLQRYKGLGEMDPHQLWETTMNPRSRVLMRVTLEDAAEAERLITILMGDGLEERKIYIQTHADFNKEDNFEIRNQD